MQHGINGNTTDLHLLTIHNLNASFSFALKQEKKKKLAPILPLPEFILRPRSRAQPTAASRFIGEGIPPNTKTPYTRSTTHAAPSSNPCQTQKKKKTSGKTADIRL